MWTPSEICFAELRTFLNTVAKGNQDEDYDLLEQYMTAALAAEVLRQRHEKLTYVFAKKTLHMRCQLGVPLRGRDVRSSKVADHRVLPA